MRDGSDGNAARVGAELADRVAVVTGAGSRSSGIGNGRAAAVLLARAGATVALVDNVASNIDETRALIEAHGGRCEAFVADVSDRVSSKAVVASIVDALGEINILVNNVGIAGPPGSVVDLDLDGWDDCLRVNLTSMVLMSRHVIPSMRRAGGGSIINMASIAGLVGGFPLLAYSTTKGAIVSLTRTMATQHGPEGVRVNALAPGFVYTPMVATQGLGDEDRELRRLAAPLRTEGTGWDVGEAVLFLACDRSRWITGTTLVVDAGLVGAGISMTSSMTVNRPVGSPS